ncbi:MAG: hypothetical protein IJ642_06245 [Oscillospiraceae bacterium]|nr:hypothetical protein [Oscillospiraceae bacterium]
MGMFAGAVFIRNEKNKSKETIIEEFQKFMNVKGYEISDSENAEEKYCFSFPEGKWFAFTFPENVPSGEGGFLARCFQSYTASADLVDDDFIDFALYQPDGACIDHEIIGTPYWDEPMFDEDISQWFRFLKDEASQEALASAVEEDLLEEFSQLIELDHNPLFLDLDNPEKYSAEMIYFKKK